MAKLGKTSLGTVVGSGSFRATDSSVFGGIQVTGVAEAIAKFGRVSQLVYMQTGRIVWNSAEMAQAKARDYVHSRENPYTDWDYTNDLKDGIGIARGGVYEQQVFASAVHNGYDYAGKEEYSPGHEFLRPAIYATVPATKAMLVKLAAEIEAV